MNYEGNDNYGQPKSDYVQKIADMGDENLKSETYDMIYQSARCANNPRADWHWTGSKCTVV